MFEDCLMIKFIINTRNGFGMFVSATTNTDKPNTFLLNFKIANGERLAFDSFFPLFAYPPYSLALFFVLHFLQTFWYRLFLYVFLYSSFKRESRKMSKMNGQLNLQANTGAVLQ